MSVNGATSAVTYSTPTARPLVLVMSNTSTPDQRGLSSSAQDNQHRGKPERSYPCCTSFRADPPGCLLQAQRNPATSDARERTRRDTPTRSSNEGKKGVGPQ